MKSEEGTLKRMTVNELKSSHCDFQLIAEMIKAWEKIISFNKDHNSKVDEHLFQVMIHIIKQFGTEDCEWN